MEMSVSEVVLSDTIVFVKVIVLILFFLIKVFGIYGSHDLHLHFLLPRTQYMTTAKAQRFLRADTVPFSESEKMNTIRLVLKKMYFTQ